MLLPVLRKILLRAKNFQHPRAIAHLHVNAMAKLSIQDMLKKTCWIEWTVDLMRNRTRRGSNCPKTEDTGKFLRLFRHLLPKIDQRSTDHSIPHHQKPLLHSWNSFKERLCDAQISKSQDTEGKMNPLAPWKNYVKIVSATNFGQLPSHFRPDDDMIKRR